MRSKSRQIAAPRKYDVRNAERDVIQVVSTNGVRKLESITDTTGVKVYNFCHHSRYFLSSVSGAFKVSQGGKLLYDHDGWYGSSCDVARWQSTLAPTLDNQFFVRGVQSIKPRLKSDFSLPNFLIELRELKTLFSSVQTALKYVRGKNIRPGRKADLVDVASDVHLSTSFGWNPLLSDISALLNSYESFYASYERFKKQAGKVNTSYYAEELSDLPSYEGQLSDGNAQWVEYCNERVISAKAVLTLVYTYSPMVEMRIPSFIDFLRYLGFRGSSTPAVVWNALPFSFVVDWVFKVGNFLESMDDGIVPVRMNILAGGYSIKYKCTKHSYLIGRDPYTITGNPFVDVDGEVYTRASLDHVWLQTLLGMTALPSFDRLSVKEVSLGLALGNKLR